MLCVKNKINKGKSSTSSEKEKKGECRVPFWDSSKWRAKPDTEQTLSRVRSARGVKEHTPWSKRVLRIDIQHRRYTICAPKCMCYHNPCVLNSQDPIIGFQKPRNKYCYHAANVVYYIFFLQMYNTSFYTSTHGHTYGCFCFYLGCIYFVKVLVNLGHIFLWIRLSNIHVTSEYPYVCLGLATGPIDKCPVSQPPRPGQPTNQLTNQSRLANQPANQPARLAHQLDTLSRVDLWAPAYILGWQILTPQSLTVEHPVRMNFYKGPWSSQSRHQETTAPKMHQQCHLTLF